MFGLLSQIMALVGRAPTPSVWASARELRAAKLYQSAMPEPSERVVLGDATAPASGARHALASSHGAPILVIGPARSGKTHGIARPTLREWRGSAVVVETRSDLLSTIEAKSENGGTRVYRFAPWEQDGNGASYNPLHDVRLGSHKEKGDVRVIATALASNAVHTPTSYRGSLTKVIECLIFYALYATHTPSLASVAEFIQPLASTGQMSKVVGATHHFPYAPFRQASNDLVRAAFELVDECRAFDAALWRDLREILLPFQGATVRRRMNWCDFHLSDLLDATDPIVVYVGNGAYGSAEQAAISHLIVAMSLHRLSERPNDTGRQVLVLVEDFARIGVMSELPGIIPYLGSYGVQLVLTESSFADVARTYGSLAGSLYENAARLVFAPASYEETCQLVSAANGAQQLLPCMLGKIPPRPANRAKVLESHVQSLWYTRSDWRVYGRSPALLLGFTRSPALVSVPLSFNNINNPLNERIDMMVTAFSNPVRFLARSLNAANERARGPASLEKTASKRGKYGRDHH